MRRLLILAIATAALIGAAVAERRIAPVRPYAPVEVTLPRPSDDMALDTFRAELAKIAKRKVYAELAHLVAAQEFFWGRDFGRTFDARKPGVDNLALALRLEHDGGAGWLALAQLAGETGMTPLESRPGVVCAPGLLGFDAIAFDRLIGETRTEPADWAYTGMADIAVRTAPQIGAATLEMLGLQFVRVLESANTPGGWTLVVGPSGAVGFVAPGALRRFGAARLCYAKDATGRWQIAGYIGTGD